jgi:hypothetical protein
MLDCHEEIRRVEVANLPRIPRQTQRQDSLQDQLRDLHIIAARLGCYDAADWLWKHGDLGGDDG